MTSRHAAVEWIYERSLTIVFLLLFLALLAGQFGMGWLDYNANELEHGAPPVTLRGYLLTGHPWEALFENWESEFLQMAAFVILTTVLYQKGSPESRRPGVKELFDIDPRSFTHDPKAPWPVRRGGWVLWVYERSLGLALLTLFLLSWLGHALGGLAAYRADQLAHGQPGARFVDYVMASRFWFESFQNWQSEFLSIAVMVWLAVYLRQRGSPESKPVHAPHWETGR
jgi:hypothetical protein